MKRWAIPRRARVACALALPALLAACSDDGAIAPGADSGGIASDANSDASGFDAASITPRPDLCEGLSRGGSLVPEIGFLGPGPPPLGGTVVAGTYDLSELDLYDDPGLPDAGQDGGEGSPNTRLTGQAAQITIVVSEFAIRTVEARGGAGGLPPERTRAVLYRVDRTSLVMTEVCPSTALPVSVSFSAVGGGLAIFTDPKHRELYVRR